MARRIKLMPDYDCWPLWGMDSDDIGNIDPSDLPLSAETISRLTDWAAQFDSWLDRDDPAASPPVPPDDAARFERDGLALWSRLQDELGPGFAVYYRGATRGLLSPDR